MDILIEKDLAAIGRLDAINMILATLQNVTKMRLALVARIDSDTWTACAIHDDMNFGLNVGDKLDLSTTY